MDTELFIAYLESVFYHFKWNEKPYYPLSPFTFPLYVYRLSYALHLYTLKPLLVNDLTVTFVHQTYFKELKRIGYYICTGIYYFCCFSFISHVPVSVCFHFPCVWRVSFSSFFRGGLLVTNFLFSLTWNVLIIPFILEG